MKKTIEMYEFCTVCQGALKRVADHKQCSICKKRYFFNPKPAACAILTDETGKILLIQRAFDPKKGFWSLPGGFVEENESFEQATIRELKEETGIEQTELNYVGSFAQDYPFEAELVSVTVAVFAGELPNNKVTPADDVSDYQFVNKKQIDYDLFAFPELREFVRNYVTKI